ncbi:MAG TPA: cytochrome c-type biogenesis protein CcmH [Candidatus Binatia bacterium]
MAFRIIVILLGFLGGVLQAAPAPDIEEQTRAISAELRCVVCQNLSVADSPSEMAQQMRTSVREQLQAGKSAQEIKDFFVSKYGEWVLLSPTNTGFNRLLWWLPLTVLIIGVVAALLLARRWATRKAQRVAPEIDPSIADRIRKQAHVANIQAPDVDDSTARAQLVRESLRLADELTELEFDFQSGKLSQSDYSALRSEVEGKQALVLQQLSSLPPEPAVKTPAKIPSSRRQARLGRSRFQRWQLATGGAFLLLFGLALGVLLTQSLRPRTSEQDSMTGDFLTGTTPGNAAIRSALEAGKRAFAKQDFPKAIDAFKKVLEADPNQPEAHSYMGMILIQAGHADGAMMAFDRALAQAPNYPMALWGKGMILYREKKDYDGARVVLQQLLRLIPPGEDKIEIEKIVASFPPPGSDAGQVSSAPSPDPRQTVSGKITIGPKVKGMNSKATLFIIARAAGVGGGPPLAVKKIDQPVFPLTYVIGAENVMMQGTPFTGKINLSVRLDTDGNPTTRTPGDLMGTYQNPVEVGARNIDIVIDQAL